MNYVSYSTRQQSILQTQLKFQVRRVLLLRRGSKLADRNTECHLAVHNRALSGDNGEQRNQMIQVVSPICSSIKSPSRISLIKAIA
jgi:hypothetical protein